MSSPAMDLLGDPVTEAPTEISALRLDNDRRVTRAIFVTLLATVSMLVVADIIVERSSWAVKVPLLLTRALMAAVLLFGLFGVVRAKTHVAFQHRLLVTMFIAVLIELALRLLRPPENITPVWLEIVLVLGCYAVVPNRPVFQALVAWTLTIGTSLILVFYNMGIGLADRTGIILTLVIANAVGMVTTRERAKRQKREEDAWRRERDAHAELKKAQSEIRILRGMLPVCAHCRRIRTESGAWQDMERFVAQHSEAQFSHGFCPDCMSQHYPGVSA